ncbi:MULTISPECIES: transposase [Roseomonadaceae]|uniref:Transposase n=1 Tax=Falsiroseomonas oleicola TaxID=2801474 RepID=A0ABS6H5E1_9PROT|nr:transposase [Roseomonas oleicola]MBU8543892.1 transposase [Roseomonas oleicola]
MKPPLTYPLRPTAPHAWVAMTDAEWAALSHYLPTGRGRPPRDRRKVWDAIFWVACGTDPWAALPKDFCDYGTAHNALMYQARNGTLDRLLLAVSRHPFSDPAMDSMEWRIVRAFRRAARQLPPYSLFMARGLGLQSALPFDPALLPEVPPHEPGMPLPPLGYEAMPRIPRRTLRGLPPPRMHVPELPRLVVKAPRRGRHLVLRSQRRV